MEDKFSHLSAISMRLFNEKQRLSVSVKEKDVKFREMMVEQAEKELAQERKFLGLPAESLDIEIDEDDLLAELMA